MNVAKYGAVALGMILSGMALSNGVEKKEKQKCVKDISGSTLEKTYKVKKHDNLSTVLYKLSQEYETPFCLYGRDAAVDRNQKLNPQIKDWHFLVPGTQLLLRFPVLKEQDTVPAPAPVSEATPILEPEPTSEVASTPEPVPTPEVAPIPEPAPPAREEKKETMSADTHIRKPVVPRTPQRRRSPRKKQHYAMGVRYGMSGDRDPVLLKESRFLGAFFLFNTPYVKKISIHYESILPSKDPSSAPPLSLGITRFAIAKDFTLWPKKLPWLFTRARLSHVSLKATLPRGAFEPYVIDPVHFTEPYNLGFQLGANFTYKRFAARPWFGMDVSGEQLMHGYVALVSREAGLNAYYDISASIDKSLRLLAFISQHSFTFAGDDPLRGVDTYLKLNMDFFYLGLGIEYAF